MPPRLTKVNNKHPRQRGVPPDASKTGSPHSKLDHSNEHERYFDYYRHSRRRRSSGVRHHVDDAKSSPNHTVHIVFDIDDSGPVHRVTKIRGRSDGTDWHRYTGCIADYMVNLFLDSKDQGTPPPQIDRDDDDATPCPLPQAQSSHHTHRKRLGSPHDTDSDMSGPESELEINKTQHWSSAGALAADDRIQVLEFFRNRFLMIGQNACKKIQIAIIDAIWKHRQGTLPYCGRPKRGRFASGTAPKFEPDSFPQGPPGFWPPGVRYQGSHRLFKHERMDVMSHLYALPVVMPEQCQIILAGEKYGNKYNSWKDLLDMVFTRQLSLKDKDRDDDEHNQRRQVARRKTLEELNRVAGELEEWMRHPQPGKKIEYKAVPSDVTLTQSAARKIHQPNDGLPPHSSTMVKEDVQPEARVDQDVCMTGLDQVTDMSFNNYDSSIELAADGGFVSGEQDGRMFAYDYASSATTSFSSDFSSLDQSGGTSTSYSYASSTAPEFGVDPTHHYAMAVGRNGPQQIFSPVPQRAYRHPPYDRPQLEHMIDPAIAGAQIRRAQSTWPAEGMPNHLVPNPQRSSDDSIFRPERGNPTLLFIRDHYEPAMQQHQVYRASGQMFESLPGKWPGHQGIAMPTQQTFAVDPSGGGPYVQNYPAGRGHVHSGAWHS